MDETTLPVKPPDAACQSPLRFLTVGLTGAPPTLINHSCLITSRSKAARIVFTIVCVCLCVSHHGKMWSWIHLLWWELPQRQLARSLYVCLRTDFVNTIVSQHKVRARRSHNTSQVCSWIKMKARFEDGCGPSKGADSRQGRK